MGNKSKKQLIEEKNRSSVQMYCKYCGHTNTIPAFVERKICHYCHRQIKNETQAYFTKKMLEKIKEMKENDKS